MNTEFENGHDILTDETKQQLKKLSKSLLSLHKILLETAKTEYERANGKIPNANAYLQLVIDDAHFAWLRKLSSMIALLDEATSQLRPATKSDAENLLNEAKVLLNLKDTDENFNNNFQNALQNNSKAVLSYNDALKILE